MIIAGDIGGTKTNIALLEMNGRESWTTVAQKSYPSRGFNSLEAILAEFFVEHQPRLTHACFGVAGPVVEGRVDATNLAWDVSAGALAEALGVERVSLINDLEAMAYGIELLDASQIHTLSEGDGIGRDGHRALIAAGTGLGMAGIFYDGVHYHPIPSEGGHIDFAPRNEIEIDLLSWLAEKFGGHVSYERVLSGPGFFNVYSFLRDRKYAEEPPWLADEICGSDDPSAAVSRAALTKKCGLAVKALDLFVDIYGAMAGNHALLMKSIGGVYIGGGIAPKIIEKLKDGAFVRSFEDKGRMKSLVASIPVHVILDDKTGMFGAAHCALKQAATAL